MKRIYLPLFSPFEQNRIKKWIKKTSDFIFSKTGIGIGAGIIALTLNANCYAKNNDQSEIYLAMASKKTVQNANSPLPAPENINNNSNIPSNDAGKVAKTSEKTDPTLKNPIFVLNSLDATISVIDPVTWTETKRIPTGKEPHHLYLTPDEKSLIVANALGNSLTFLDPKTAEIQRVVRDISDPYHLRFSPDMKWFVTAANRLNHVDIYSWDGKDIKLIQRIPTSKTPSHLWIDSQSKTVYSSMQDSDEIIAIDLATQTLKWRVKTGSLPADVYGSNDDKLLFVGLTGGTGVEVYDISANPAKLLKTIPTGAGAHAFRAVGDKRHIYVSNRVANTISKIDMQTQTVVDSLPGPSGPDDMDVSPDGKLILLSSRWAKKMTVIDTQTKQIVRQINVGKSPHGVWTLDHANR